MKPRGWGLEVKKRAFVFLFFVSLFLLLPIACISAVNVKQVEIAFRLEHEVHVDSSFFSEFRNPGTDTKITEVQFANPGTYRFATLIIGINRSIAFSSISVSFGPLVHNENNNAFYDYSMRLLNPGYDTVLAEAVPDDEAGHGAGSAVFTAVTFTKPVDSGSIFEEEIVDFEITLDDSTAIAGTYSGNITCVFTK